MSPIEFVLGSISKLRSLHNLSKINAKGKNCFIAPSTTIINGKYIKLGNNVAIGQYCRIQAVAQYHGKLFSPEFIFEDNVTVNWFSHIACAGKLIIGEGTLIADYVFICDNNHGFSTPDTFKQLPELMLLEIKPVSIGKRCWIGTHVCILPGVTIGDDCVIGAGSVVTKSIKPGRLAVGVPCKPIKKRNDNGEWVKLQQSPLSAPDSGSDYYFSH